VLLGLVIGGVWTLLQPDRYRAEANVLLRGASASRLAPAVETLANGSVLEQNVKQTLRVTQRPDLSARANEGVVSIFAEAGSAERARQTGAEAAQVLTQLVAARFRSQGLQATLLDPAHVVDQTSPTPLRNLLICGLLGLAAGGGVAYARSRQHPAWVVSGVVGRDIERRLKQRIDEVTKRERALARRAGELSQREAGLEQRRGELEQLGSQLEQRDAELGAREREVSERVRELDTTKHDVAARASDVAASELEGRPAAPAPPPETQPETSRPPVAAPPPMTRAGRWNVNDFQRAVDSHSGATAEQAEEWRTYLFFLREHASVDGSLPPQFDGLVEQVFGDVIR
jgi:hypothetical protein